MNSIREDEAVITTEEKFGLKQTEFDALPNWKKSQLNKNHATSVVITRQRTATDAVSGLALNRSDFPTYSDDELLTHFTTFTQYDLDSSGFISPQNLLDVLTAMEVPEASEEMVKLIIEEVAVLTGHENDGKLSFRDYMTCMEMDHQAAMHNLALDAEEELAVTVEEEKVESGRFSQGDATGGDDAPADVSDDAPATATLDERVGKLRPSLVNATTTSEEGGMTRRRQSSMSAVNAVAVARIKAFQMTVNAAAAQNKINAFKKTEYSGPIVNSEEIHMMTLKNKVQAFEVAARFKGKVELKKTWREVGASRYNPGKKIMLNDLPAKPPPKKKLSDLP